MGIWVEELRRSLRKRAPKILQILKDDRAGKKSLKPTQRKAAMILLRKVMTAQEIRAELNKVSAATPTKRKRNETR